jgi:hypothetical protein
MPSIDHLCHIYLNQYDDSTASYGPFPKALSQSSSGSNQPLAEVQLAAPNYGNWPKRHSHHVRPFAQHLRSNQNFYR